MEQNYKIYDKEMPAIICMLEEWRHFLEEVTHLVDHHHPRHTIGKPNALSRRADHGNGASNNKNVVLL